MARRAASSGQCVQVLTGAAVSLMQVNLSGFVIPAPARTDSFFCQVLLVVFSSKIL